MISMISFNLNNIFIKLINHLPSGALLHQLYFISRNITSKIRSTLTRILSKKTTPPTNPDFLSIDVHHHDFFQQTTLDTLTPTNFFLTTFLSFSKIVRTIMNPKVNATPTSTSTHVSLPFHCFSY